MDAATRPAATTLEAQLFAEGERFSYFQAVRLLRRQARLEGRDPDAMRVRPHLALSFPETDIDRIEHVALPPRHPLIDGESAQAFATGEHDDAVREVPRITANFFGLYGVSSPLPSFYTEDLLEEEREGRRGMREFLDILHYALYPLLFDGWLKYRPQIRIVEEGDANMLDQLYAFAGLHDRTIRNPNQPGVGDLLRYAGLFAQRPHTTLGLLTMLADAFAPATVDVVNCIEDWLDIPADQRAILGGRDHRLGCDCYLGSRIRDSTNQLRIELRDVPEPLFDALQPGREAHERLRFLVRLYLVSPFDVTVTMTLRTGEAQPCQLGGTRWNTLGRNSWLAPCPQSPARAAAMRL